jgi:hypothetical protein
MDMAYHDEPKDSFVEQKNRDSFINESANRYSKATPLRPYTPQSSHRTMRSVESTENLVQGAAPLGGNGESAPRRISKLPGRGKYRGAAY